MASALPLKLTTELLMKPEPLTVSVNAPEPAMTPVGERDVIIGAGLGVVPAPAWLMVNVWQPAVMVSVRAGPVFWPTT